MHSNLYPAFSSEMSTMLNYLNNEEIVKRLKINIDNISDLKKLSLDFNSLLKKYTDPAQNTKVITQQIKDDYTTSHQWVTNFRQAIKANNKGKLSEDDYLSLFIHKNKPHSKHTVPKIEPNLNLEHINHLNARIIAQPPEAHDKGTRPSLPEGVDNIQWNWVINTNAQASAELNYSEHKTTQSATLNLKFSENQVTQFCHIKACYGITNGQLGSYSLIVSFAIT